MPSFLIAQNPVVESLDAVPEFARPCYAEGADDNAGKFVLTDAMKPMAEAYDGVTTKIDSLTKQNGKLNTECAARRVAVKGFEDLAAELELDFGEDASKIPDLLRDSMTALRAQAKNGEEVTVNMDKVKEAADKRVAQAAADAKISTDKMRASLERYMITGAATAAIAEAKGNATLLLPHVKNFTRVVEDGEDFVARVVDEAGDVRMGPAGSPMTVAELVAEMKRDTNFAQAFASDTPGGNGTTPRSGPSAPAKKTGEARSSTQKIAAGLTNMQNGAR